MSTLARIHFVLFVIQLVGKLILELIFCGIGILLCLIVLLVSGGCVCLLEVPIFVCDSVSGCIDFVVSGVEGGALWQIEYIKDTIRIYRQEFNAARQADSSGRIGPVV